MSICDATKKPHKNFSGQLNVRFARYNVSRKNKNKGEQMPRRTKNSHDKQAHTATTTNKNLSQSNQTHATIKDTTKPTKPTSQMHLSKSQYLRGVQFLGFLV